ncbi:uncharacterized protein LOC122195184 [Lactuca sativa]|uniref:uncharacterized protein LOC122195184 n=1 Tax=Lactuca sativa TaxID=4236 RepID=UPI001C691255|nr:uncharacterized protein LOC122195184 [Lactuca sativa]
MVNEYVVDSLFKNILLIHSLRICRILKEYVLDAFLVKSEVMEEVENHVFPSCTTKEITFKETPNKVFRREHENLVKEAEKSMKAVALITTIVFSAAITVPGGSNQETDAISLFASSSTLLMFLSILTGSFDKKDFLFILPRRLMVGLCALMLSTIAMMVAFGATLFLVFFHEIP